ncbi:MAG: outer membrane lipoprotein carrier protein [Halioglobus sp.]|jgi:outer membrane lipoprotein carrier protein
MKNVLLLFCMILWAAASAAQAETQPQLQTSTQSSADDLQSFSAALSEIEKLRGEFVQRQFGEDGSTLLETTGRFSLLRPGYFSWEILAPDNQIIIADPQFLWQHDRDLETVTRRPISDGVQMAPLQILDGNEAALRQGFEVVKGTGSSFTLTPLQQDVGFRQLTVHLQGGLISSMDMRDSLDQRVEIVFSSLDADSDLKPADFAFIPPPGADLFYYDQ